MSQSNTFLHNLKDVAGTTANSHQEIGEKSVVVSVKVAIAAAQLSRELLLKIFGQVGNQIYKIQAGEVARTGDGTISLEKLSAQGKKLEHIQLESKDLKGLKKSLKKYAVDFSVYKEKDSGMLQLFFKAQDKERLASVLKSCIKEQLNKKAPMKEQLENAKEKAEGRNAERSKELSKTVDRHMQKGLER